MFKILCKIWRFIVKIFRMIADTIKEVVTTLVKDVMQLAGEIWRGIFGSDGIGIGGILVLGLAGWGLWTAYGAYSENKEKKELREYDRQMAEEERSFQRELAFGTRA